MSFWPFARKNAPSAPPRPDEEYMVRCVSGWLWQAYRLKQCKIGAAPTGPYEIAWFYDAIVPASETCPSREAAEWWIAYDRSGLAPDFRAHTPPRGWPRYSEFRAYYDADGNLIKEDDPPAQGGVTEGGDGEAGSGPGGTSTRSRSDAPPNSDPADNHSHRDNNASGKGID